MKQTLTELKKETDKFKIIVDDFNTPLAVMDRTSREKISKEISNLTR